MKIYKEKNYNEASKKAASIIAAQITLKPDSILGLATGSTPIGAYEKLVDSYKTGELDFSGITSINLDEYRGLSPEHDQSYRYFMNLHLFNHVNINKSNTFVPDGLEKDADKACRLYNSIIEKCGGIDLQLLGLGHNGHIGFNEPDTKFTCDTHCVDLTPSTIEANTRFFNSQAEVPKQAYTMGIRTIMQARRVLLMVTGEAKADILKKVLYGPVTPEVPASILQLHKHLYVVADEEAAKYL